jgi:hypothetical protein
MIARIWRGVTPAEKADQYLEYLEKTGLKDYRAVPGNQGVQVLRRTYEGKTEFLLISLWESYETIRAFAGCGLPASLSSKFARDNTVRPASDVAQWSLSPERTLRDSLPYKIGRQHTEESPLVGCSFLCPDRCPSHSMRTLLASKKWRDTMIHLMEGAFSCWIKGQRDH